jgi:hypothetical protein
MSGRLDGWYWAVRWTQLDPSWDELNPEFAGQYPTIIHVYGHKVSNGGNHDESLRLWRLLKPIKYWGERVKNDGLIPPAEDTR